MFAFCLYVKFSFKFLQMSWITKELIKHENKFNRKVFHNRQNSENRFSEFFYFMKGLKKYIMNISRAYRIPGLWTQELVAGLWTLDSGLWTLGSGRWTLDSGHWTLDAGRWTLDSGRWTLDAEPWTLDSGR